MKPAAGCLAGIAVLFLTVLLPWAQEGFDWRNPQVTGRNRLPPRAEFLVYRSKDDARAGGPDRAPWVQSLNGSWQFRWAQEPSQRPRDFHQPSYDAGDWARIPVPSTWESQGYGPDPEDGPYAFGPSDPPHIPYDRNPVGSYRTRFQLPESWAGRRVIVHFAGVEAAFYLWLNGQEVGYSQGSRSPAEFDLTPHVSSGGNVLAVEVYGFSEGSYLDSPEAWRRGGIFRDVFLYSTANVQIRDFWVRTDLDDEYEDAELKLQVGIRNHGTEGTVVQVQVELVDGNEQVFGPRTQSLTLEGNEEVLLPFSRRLRNPRKWSAEDPYLYSLLMTLVSEEGKVLEVIPTPVGFREVEGQGTSLTVNGLPVVLHREGAPRPAGSETESPTEESMAREIARMKEHNLNAARSSRYANLPAWRSLCDRLGIYLLADAGLEAPPRASETSAIPSTRPQWRQAYLDRVRSMVEWEKNHPSIILWSVGKAAGHGENPTEARAWIRERDPDRPVE